MMFVYAAGNILVAITAIPYLELPSRYVSNNKYLNRTKLNITIIRYSVSRDSNRFKKKTMAPAIQVIF